MFTFWSGETQAGRPFSCDCHGFRRFDRIKVTYYIIIYSPELHGLRRSLITDEYLLEFIKSNPTGLVGKT